MVHKFKKGVTEILLEVVGMHANHAKSWNLNAACLTNVSLL